MILNEVIARLVIIFDAATPWPVVDGPKPEAVNHREFVLVGSTGEDEDGGVIDRVSSDLGPGTWRDESGEVICSVWSWSGGNDLSQRRALALATTSTLIEAVEADPSLGGLLTAPQLAEVLDVRYQPRQTETGAIVRVVFTVSYRTLET